jgi:hypothetical protein
VRLTLDESTGEHVRAQLAGAGHDVDTIVAEQRDGATDLRVARASLHPY